MQATKNTLFQSGRIHMLPIERISPNPRQPRRHFPEQPLRELADSIRQHGVLQPLTVQKTPGGYVLVAGERRLRAAGLAGLTHVPCLLVRATPQDSALLALVEKPSFHMKDTIEAQDLVREHQQKPIAECNLVGPIAYDLILSKEAVRLKGYDNELCGDFDGIVAPSLLAGNLIVKCWQTHTSAQTCGIIVGAKIPVAITSRSDDKDVAFRSLAFCCVLPREID